MTASGLTDADRRALLALARRAIAAHLAGEPPPELPRAAALDAPGAGFVTLRQDGDLRGCVGTIARELPLAQVVRDMAVAAATRDPRFPPLPRAELDATALEVSVLTPPERVAGAEAIALGRHGVALRLHGRHGLLLPQVAPEQGWDVTTLLVQLCRKAGLPPDAWRDPAAVLERFEADVFTDRAD